MTVYTLKGLLVGVIVPSVRTNCKENPFTRNFTVKNQASSFCVKIIFEVRLKPMWRFSSISLANPMCIFRISSLFAQKLPLSVSVPLPCPS